MVENREIVVRMYLPKDVPVGARQRAPQNVAYVRRLNITLIHAQSVKILFSSYSVMIEFRMVEISAFLL